MPTLGDKTKTCEPGQFHYSIGIGGSHRMPIGPDADDESIDFVEDLDDEERGVL